MKYIQRSLERKFIRMNEFFKTVLVTGARQVGKTTMLRYLAKSAKSFAN
jgi:predicted AAA+ superfamily ATPase